MKKKQGFTIIELLAVLSILMLMSLIIIPTIFSSLDKAKEKEYNRLMNIISEAAETYYLKYKQNFPEITTTTPGYVSLKQLKETYLDETLKNPITEQELKDESLVRIIVNDKGILEYTYTNASFASGILPRKEVAIGTSYTIQASDISTDGSIQVLVDGNKVELPYNLPTTENKTYIITYQINTSYDKTSLTRSIVVS